MTLGCGKQLGVEVDSTLFVGRWALIVGRRKNKTFLFPFGNCEW